MKNYYFTHNGVKYRIMVKKTASPFNYDHFAHLFRAGDNSPLTGWTCKADYKICELKGHFIRAINNYRADMEELAQKLGLEIK